MDVEPRATDDQTREHLIEIVLVSGEQIRTRLGPDEEVARAKLAGLHGRLQEDLFLRVGDDTIVRAEEVRWLQLRPHDGNDHSLMNTLLTKVRGGDEMGSYETQRTQHNQGGMGGLAPWVGYGRRPFSETKPFFLTSEFIAFVAMLATLLIVLAVSDSLNQFRGWLLPTILTSAYILSRGIAKAGERDPNPDRGRESEGLQGGYGQQGAYAQGGYTDRPLARETEPYGTVPR